MRWLWLVLLFIGITAESAPATQLVQVQTRGATLDEAKRNGFREAIERVVGSLVISQSELQNNKLVRDDIFSYSAGYIDQYEITGQETAQGQVTLDMLVKVKSSKLAERFLVSKQVDQHIDGGRLSTQVKTLLEERYNGDQVLAELLNGYPHNTFQIKTGEGQLAFDRHRNPYVVVDYEIAWSPLYLEALAEAMEATSAKADSCNGITRAIMNGLQTGNHAEVVRRKASEYCGNSSDLRIVHSRSLLGIANHFSFNDPYRLDLINHQFRPNDRTILLGLTTQFVDRDGNTLGATCTAIHPNRLIVYRENGTIGVINLRDRVGTMQIDIDGGYRLRGQVNISVNPDVVERVDRLKFTIEKGC